MVMDNGTYTYTAPANVLWFTDTIPFVLVDNDGDTSGNNRTVVSDAGSQADHSYDHVITNSGREWRRPDRHSGLRAAVQRQRSGFQTITITGVSAWWTVRWHMPAFSWLRKRAATPRTAAASPTRVRRRLTDTCDRRSQPDQHSTLDGTGLRHSHRPRWQRQHLNGDEGNDVLIGGNQGDILNGGTATT